MCKAINQPARVVANTTFRFNVSCNGRQKGSKYYIIDDVGSKMDDHRA
jgi:hypothetical protein